MIFKQDGFVKSPTFALRLLLRFFKVRKVLIITQDLRALPNLIRFGELLYFAIENGFVNFKYNYLGLFCFLALFFGRVFPCVPLLIFPRFVRMSPFPIFSSPKIVFNLLNM